MCVCGCVSGVYSERYGSDLANCNVTVWNPLGNGLSYEDFAFPVFALKDENQTQVIRKVCVCVCVSLLGVCVCVCVSLLGVCVCVSLS